MYYDFIQQHKHRFKLAALAFIVLIAWWGIATFIDENGKIPVVVSAVPSDARVTFNGKSEGNGTHWLPAGIYSVSISKAGFKTASQKVIVTNKKEQNVVAASLNPESRDAKNWAQQHAADYANNQTYGSIEATSNGRYFSALNPITTRLPYNDPYFTIGYITNDDQSITLTVVTPSPRYRFYAVDEIRKLGYSPTDFKIIFKDFHNPLGTK